MSHEDPAHAQAPTPTSAEDAAELALVNGIEALDTSDPVDDAAGMALGGGVDAGAGGDIQPQGYAHGHAQSGWTSSNVSGAGAYRQARPPPFLPNGGHAMPGLGIGNLPPQLALNLAYTPQGVGAGLGMGSVVNGTGVPGQPGSVPVSVTNAYAAAAAAGQLDPSLPGIAVSGAGELSANGISPNGTNGTAPPTPLTPASAQYAHAGNNYLQARGYGARQGAGGHLSAGLPAMGMGMGMHGMQGNGGPSSAPATHSGGFYGMNGGGYGMVSRRRLR